MNVFPRSHWQVSDGSVSLTVSCDSNIDISSSSSRRTTRIGTEEFVQFQTELFACYEIHVEVIGEHKMRQSVDERNIVEYFVHVRGDDRTVFTHV